MAGFPSVPAHPNPRHAVAAAVAHNAHLLLAGVDRVVRVAGALYRVPGLADHLGDAVLAVRHQSSSEPGSLVRPRKPWSTGPPRAPCLACSMLRSAMRLRCSRSTSSCMLGLTPRV